MSFLPLGVSLSKLKKHNIFHVLCGEERVGWRAGPSGGINTQINIWFCFDPNLCTDARRAWLFWYWKVTVTMTTRRQREFTLLQGWLYRGEIIRIDKNGVLMYTMTHYLTANLQWNNPAVCDKETFVQVTQTPTNYPPVKLALLVVKVSFVDTLPRSDSLLEVIATGKSMKHTVNLRKRVKIFPCSALSCDTSLNAASNTGDLMRWFWGFKQNLLAN